MNLILLPYPSFVAFFVLISIDSHPPNPSWVEVIAEANVRCADL